jgi:Phage capsid family
MSEYMFPALKEAQGKLDHARKAMADVFAEAGPDMDMSKVKSIAGAADDAAKLAYIRETNDTEIPALKKRVDELRAVAAAAEAAKSYAAERGTEHGADRPEAPKFKSLGDAIMDSVAVKGKQRGSDSGPGVTLDIDMKAQLTAFGTPNFASSSGWDPFDPRTGHVQLEALRPANLVYPWFSATTTSFSTVKYMEETQFGNTDGTGDAAEAQEGAAYAQTSLALTERSSEVRKVTVWLPFTDEQMEDEPRARDYINNRLMYQLQARVDSQLLLGNGSAPNLLGTNSVSGINTQALGTDSVPDALYKAIRQVRATGFSEPNVTFISPTKWEGVRLLKTANGDYVWGHPATSGAETIWGLPVQLTTLLSTTAFVGDYARQAEIAVRRGVDVQVTNSHASLFVSGQQAIRADLRLAVIHYRPTAFTKVTGL